MTVIRPVACGLAYGGYVPAEHRAVVEGLRQLIHAHCIEPYFESGAKIGLVLRVDGKDPTNPLKQSGIRLCPLKNNVVGADIYIREADWDVPLSQLRACLWRTTEKAIWACIKRLERNHVSVNEALLKQHLSLIASEFFDNSREDGQITSLAAVKPLPLLGKNAEQQIVIQYRIDGHESARDHDRRVTVEDLVDNFLGEFNLGYCDGGDIGSGTMNIFCQVKPDQTAASKLIDLLQKNDLLEGAVLAKITSRDEKVIWPPDFKGEFTIL